MSDFDILLAALPLILLVLLAGCIMIISVVRANKDDLVVLARVFTECVVDLTERVIRVQREERNKAKLELKPSATTHVPSVEDDA